MPGKIIISELDYKKCELLIDSAIIEDNHKLLDSTINNIEDSVLLCDYPEIELNKMRSEIFYIPPEFLINPTKKELAEILIDIEIYKKEYESLCTQINDFVEQTSKSLKNLLIPSKNLQNEINSVINQFELTVKNLSIPLISEREGLDKIEKNKLSNEQKDIFDEDKLSVAYKIEEFKKESEGLNKIYNKSFNQINKAISTICNNIKEIPSTISEFQDQVEEGMSKYEEILEKFNDENKIEVFKKYLIKIKKSLELILKRKNEIIDKIKDKINNLDNQYLKRKQSFMSLKDKSNKIINNLKAKSNSIQEDINEIRKKINEKKIQLPEIEITQIITENVFDSMKESVESIKKVNNSVVEGIKEIGFSFIEKTSLDLLFIMDTTGSMEQFVDITKEKIIKIIEMIKNKCIGIDINLGFIGYKDLSDPDFLDIGFTQNYKNLEQEISKIIVGGGDDTAEDLARAIDNACKKQWNSNARFAILVTDAPCHGLKYHDKNIIDFYPNGDPNGKNIEELVEKMAELNISFICVKLKEDTDIMYKIFEKIYEKYKSINNCQFHIIKLYEPENLVQIVEENATNIYYKQRLNKNEVSNI